jgi:SAM-dependent methyltransferase
VNPDLDSNRFDAIFCAHVLYHIGKDNQETAVRQMLRLAKPEGSVLIVYANPRTFFTLPGELMRRLPQRSKPGGGKAPKLYYHAHPLRWWRRFRTEASFQLLPGDVIGARPARALLKSGLVASAFYRAALTLERRAPALAARLWHYPMFLLRKGAGRAP